MRSLSTLSGGIVFAWLLAASPSLAKDCKTEPIKKTGAPYISKSLGAYPDSLFAWRAAVLEKHGNGWQAWRNAEDTKVDCEVTTVDGKKRWVCTRTGRPCLGPISQYTNAAEKPKFERTLRRGDQGDDVKALQKALNGLGFELEIDGNYGRGTRDAIKAFQKANKLTTDGSFGPATQEKLLSQI